MLSLAERLRRHERQKARLLEREQALQLIERKERARRFRTAGELVEKVGLLNLEPAALYGALLQLAASAKDEAAVSRWTAAGNARIAHEEAEAAKERRPIVITIPGPITRQIAGAMNGAGFRRNKTKANHWEGWCVPEHAVELAATFGGQMQLIGGDPPPAAQPALPEAAE